MTGQTERRFRRPVHAGSDTSRESTFVTTNPIWHSYLPESCLVKAVPCASATKTRHNINKLFLDKRYSAVKKCSRWIILNRFRVTAKSFFRVGSQNGWRQNDQIHFRVQGSRRIWLG